MRKIITMILGLAVAVLAIESLEPGLTNVKCEDRAVFSNEVLLGGGDTVWTDAYGFYSGGFEGIFCVSFNIDTFAACSSKVRLILREGNDVGDWMLQDTVLTIDHAPSDWDTLVEFDPLPTFVFWLGWVCLNGSNDSVKLSDVKIFAIKD